VQRLNGASNVPSLHVLKNWLRALMEKVGYLGPERILCRGTPLYMTSLWAIVRRVRFLSAGRGAY
jgi:hypothetical protein